MNNLTSQYCQVVPVVAFDLDGTLTVRDCVMPFMHDISGKSLIPRVIAKNPTLVTGSLVTRDRDRLKAAVVRECFSGQHEELILDSGKKFAQRIANRWLRADTVARLRWHQSQGHLVVIVSASLSPYVSPLGDILGVDATLCTELEAVDGILTGNIRGENCRSHAKVDRLKEWGRAKGLADSNLLTHAYGDSAGDRHLLQFAEQAHYVKRKAIAPSC